MDTNLSKFWVTLKDSGTWHIDSPWSHKKSDTILRLNNNNYILSMSDPIYFFGLRTNILFIFKPQQFYWILNLKSVEDI